MNSIDRFTGLKKRHLHPNGRFTDLCIYRHYPMVRCNGQWMKKWGDCLTKCRHHESKSRHERRGGSLFLPVRLSYDRAVDYAYILKTPRVTVIIEARFCKHFYIYNNFFLKIVPKIWGSSYNPVRTIKEKDLPKRKKIVQIMRGVPVHWVLNR